MSHWKNETNDRLEINDFSFYESLQEEVNFINTALEKHLIHYSKMMELLLFRFF